MKLRIKGNSIRIRLTQTEVENFGANGIVEECVDFGGQNNSNFGYVLEKSSVENLSASFADGKILVSVPQTVAERWVSTEDVGIEGVDGSLRILVEKDFVCLTPRKGEDESDNFPHPESDKSC